MKKVLLSLLACASVSAFATVGDISNPQTKDNKTYCKDIGGSVKTVTPKYYYSSYSFDEGLPIDLCVIKTGKHEDFIGLDTLSAHSSIASTILQKGKLLNPSSQEPLGDICQKFGGADSYLNSSYDSSTELCFFGDGSSVGLWTMFGIMTGNVNIPLRSTPLAHYRVPTNI